MMANLDDHFGSNAEVEQATGKVITEFLVQHAGHGERHSAHNAYQRYYLVSAQTPHILQH